jgi:hypothetical protein
VDDLKHIGLLRKKLTEKPWNGNHLLKIATWKPQATWFKSKSQELELEESQPIISLWHVI